MCYGGQCGHHRRTANRVEHGTDNTAVDAVVGKVPHQLGPHLDAGLHTLWRDLDELQAQGFVEDNFFFVDLAKTFDVLGFQNDRGQVNGGACL